MKFHCSLLNYDLFMNNLNDDNHECGEIEASFYDLFQCEQYTLFRYQLHHETESFFWKNILNGDYRLSH